MPQTHGNKLKFPVLFDRDQFNRLADLAKRRGIGVSTLVRMIVNEYLERLSGEAK